MKEYTRILGQYASGLKFDDIPGPAIEQAKKIILHTVGVSVASADMETTVNAAKFAAAKGGTPDATVWGAANVRVPIDEAVYANGTAADVLDWEDCTWTGHASAAAIPAALACGEKYKSDGKSVLAAIVAAYEVYQRVAMAVQPEFDSYLAQKRGWGLVNWNTFASAVAAAKLIGLDGEKMAACLSLAGHIAPCVMGKDGGGDIYHYDHGISAKSGVNSAQLTEIGHEYFYNGLEGDNSYWTYVSNQVDYDWMDRELGTTFYITETLLKNWPSNIWCQAPLDAIDHLCRSHSLGLHNIRKIRVSPTIDITSKKRVLPLTLIQAEYSLPYCAACYLKGMEPSAQWFGHENRSSAELDGISNLVEYFGPQANRLHMFRIFWEGTFPETEVEIEDTNGRTYRHSLREPKGHPRNNFTMAEEKEFFRKRSSAFIGEGNAARFVDMVENLESCSDINALTALLNRAHPA